MQRLQPQSLTLMLAKRISQVYFSINFYDSLANIELLK